MPWIRFRSRSSSWSLGSFKFIFVWLSQQVKYFSLFWNSRRFRGFCVKSWWPQLKCVVLNIYFSSNVKWRHLFILFLFCIMTTEKLCHKIFSKHRPLFRLFLKIVKRLVDPLLYTTKIFDWEKNIFCPGFKILFKNKKCFNLNLTSTDWRNNLILKLCASILTSLIYLSLHCSYFCYSFTAIFVYITIKYQSLPLGESDGYF